MSAESSEKNLQENIQDFLIEENHNTNRALDELLPSWYIED